MKGGKCSLLLLSSPSAASLFRSFTSFPHSLSLFLSLIQNPIRYHNRRSILKQRPSMDGDSSWSARLSSASRRYQSALQSRSGSPSLLSPQFNSFFTFSSFSPSPIQDEVSVTKKLQLARVRGLDFMFRCLKRG